MKAVAAQQDMTTDLGFPTPSEAAKDDQEGQEAEEVVLEKKEEEEEVTDEGLEQGPLHAGPDSTSCGAAARSPGSVLVSERDLNPPGLLPPAARLLVVCSKFETGYDDPRLGALFIDR
jgi:hypothetical protein